MKREENNQLIYEARKKDTPIGDDKQENYANSKGNLIQLGSYEQENIVYVPKPAIPNSKKKV